MASSLEFMDLGAGNVVGSYATLEEALTMLRASYKAHGEASLLDLVLIEASDDGSQRLVSDDHALIELVTARPMSNQPA